MLDAGALTASLLAIAAGLDGVAKRLETIGMHREAGRLRISETSVRRAAGAAGPFRAMQHSAVTTSHRQSLGIAEGGVWTTTSKRFFLDPASCCASHGSLTACPTSMATLHAASPAAAEVAESASFGRLSTGYSGELALAVVEGDGLVGNLECLGLDADAASVRSVIDELASSCASHQRRIAPHLSREGGQCRRSTLCLCLRVGVGGLL